LNGLRVCMCGPGMHTPQCGWVAVPPALPPAFSGAVPASLLCLSCSFPPHRLYPALLQSTRQSHSPAAAAFTSHRCREAYPDPAQPLWLLLALQELVQRCGVNPKYEEVAREAGGAARVHVKVGWELQAVEGRQQACEAGGAAWVHVQVGRGRLAWQGAAGSWRRAADSGRKEVGSRQQAAGSRQQAAGQPRGARAEQSVKQAHLMDVAVLVLTVVWRNISCALLPCGGLLRAEPALLQLPVRIQPCCVASGTTW